MNYRESLKLTIGLVWTMLILSACDLPSTTLSTTNPSSAPPPSTDTFPTGLPFDCPDCGSNLKGFTQIFYENGTGIVYKWGEVELTGKWLVEGDVFITGDTWCQDILTMPASYKWHFDGKFLTFEMIEDTCSDRIDSWDGLHWQLLETIPVGTYSARGGDSILEIGEDNTFAFSKKNGTYNTSGAYATNGNQITWETDSFCDQSDSGLATYTWVSENNMLMFRVIGRDKCLDRLAFLKGPFTKNNDK